MACRYNIKTKTYKISKDIYTKNWGKNPIILSGVNMELIPKQLHLKEDGDLYNKPSICIVMSGNHHNLPTVYGQVSIRMLNEALNELGYQITQVKDK